MSRAKTTSISTWLSKAQKPCATSSLSTSPCTVSSDRPRPSSSSKPATALASWPGSPDGRRCPGVRQSERNDGATGYWPGWGGRSERVTAPTCSGRGLPDALQSGYVGAGEAVAQAGRRAVGAELLGAGGPEQHAGDVWAGQRERQRERGRGGAQFAGQGGELTHCGEGRGEAGIAERPRSAPCRSAALVLARQHPAFQAERGDHTGARRRQRTGHHGIL